ncbi:MAG TPA: NADH-ubiquinone oxidoreductase-F iron-sulfur binding region domain-containing protein, partial [Spirochaetota bacterium]|nr:NADH-ubiquinone oxidoreductase-F iron-sulfur binding region domain-containing protein [Spirochaetota bacterium]
KFFLEFTIDESCGKCAPCRVGNKRLLELLEKVTNGQATEEIIPQIEQLCATIKKASLCGLGQTSPNPVLSTLRYFRNEYDEHIKDKKCRSKVCKALLKYEIVPDKCNGCTRCARSCPVQCISGKVKEVHTIDQKACIKCGVCYTNCKFNAIIVS